MKTSELIAKAKHTPIEKFADGETIKLVNDLIDRLESAYEDIYINCSTCIHYPCNHRADCFNNEYKCWKWSGDAE